MQNTQVYVPSLYLQFRPLLCLLDLSIWVCNMNSPCESLTFKSVPPMVQPISVAQARLLSPETVLFRKFCFGLLWKYIHNSTASPHFHYSFPHPSHHFFKIVIASLTCLFPFHVCLFSNSITSPQSFPLYHRNTFHVEESYSSQVHMKYLWKLTSGSKVKESV